MKFNHRGTPFSILLSLVATMILLEGIRNMPSVHAYYDNVEITDKGDSMMQDMQIHPFSLRRRAKALKASPKATKSKSGVSKGSKKSKKPSNHVKKIKNNSTNANAVFIIDSPAKMKAAMVFSEAATLSDSRVEGSHKIFYNLTVNPGGIVTLANIQDLVASVNCSEVTGIVKINLKNDFGIVDPQEFYPIGAVLAIDSSIFGPCEPVPAVVEETDNPDPPSPINIPIDDFFFVIDKVEGTLKNTVITGRAQDYFALFQKGTIEIDDTVDEPRSRELVPILLNGKIVDITLDTISVDVEEYNTPIIDRETKLTFKNKCRTHFLADWNDTGIYIILQGNVLFDLSASDLIRLKVTLPISNSESRDVFPSIPLFGETFTPEFVNAKQFLEKLNVKLPTFKLGVFLEMPIVWEVFFHMDENLVIESIAEYSSANTTFTIGFASGTVIKTFETISQPTLQLNINPYFESPYTYNPTGSFTFKGFLGLRPQIIFYVSSLFKARISTEIGLSAVGQMLSDAEGFPAVDEPDLDTIGSCKECHALEIEFQRTLRKQGFFVEAAVELINRVLLWKKLKTTIFEHVIIESLSVAVLAMCLFTQSLAKDQCTKELNVEDCTQCLGLIECLQASRKLAKYAWEVYMCFVLYEGRILPDICYSKTCYETDCDHSCKQWLDCMKTANYVQQEYCHEHYDAMVWGAEEYAQKCTAITNNCGLG